MTLLLCIFCVNKRCSSFLDSLLLKHVASLRTESINHICSGLIPSKLPTISRKPKKMSLGFIYKICKFFTRYGWECNLALMVKPATANQSWNEFLQIKLNSCLVLKKLNFMISLYIECVVAGQNQSFWEICNSSYLLVNDDQISLLDNLNLGFGCPDGTLTYMAKEGLNEASASNLSYWSEQGEICYAICLDEWPKILLLKNAPSPVAFCDHFPKLGSAEYFWGWQGPGKVSEVFCSPAKPYVKPRVNIHSLRYLSYRQQP